jgi:transcription initiation factor TFIID subunit 2
LFHLLKLFQAWFCFEPDVETHDPFGFRCIPRTNDFGDFTLYFLKKVSHIVALSFLEPSR